jgi:hypothetical protein
MVYRGIVKNGVVVFGGGAELPDGTEVRIEAIARKENLAAEGPTLAEQFGDVIGAVPDLPPDMAENHGDAKRGRGR